MGLITPLSWIDTSLRKLKINNKNYMEKYYIVGEDIVELSDVFIGTDKKLYKCSTLVEKPFFRTPKDLREGEIIIATEYEGNVSLSVGTSKVVLFPKHKESCACDYCCTPYKEEEPKVEAILIARPVYYNKFSQYVCDSNDVPLVEVLGEDDRIGQFISEAINNFK